MNRSQRAFRKAAILIDTLDPRSVDALMQQIDPDLAARVRQAVMDLGSVQQGERDGVIQDFVQGGRLKPAAVDIGIELDDSLAAKLAARPGETTLPVVADATPFRFLHEAAGETLAAFLRCEHPQTIAVVVSHLPPQRAADVLACLPTDLQTNVLRRVAELDEMDPTVVREVERELESLVSEELRTSQRRSAGLAAVQAILGAADVEHRQQILSQLTQSDQRLAAQLLESSAAHDTRSSRHGQAVEAKTNFTAPRHALKSPLSEPKDGVRTAPAESTSPETSLRGPDVIADAQQPAIEFTFDDLAHFDDYALARLLQLAEPQVTLLALTGARRDFVDRILRQLPAREAKALEKEMGQSGPLRLRDVDQAQQHLAHLAGQLAAEGRIPMPPSRRFAMAA